MAIVSAFIESVYQLWLDGITDRVEILEKLKDGKYPDVYMFNVDNALHQIRIGVYPTKVESEDGTNDIEDGGDL
ncbi:hypothetical protein VPHD528_0065 [Vibrio phage D528]|nr:hypothetical protein MYOV002v2_p0061 [Vibrio phage 144E46.1]